jgi:hypothetical protein
MTRIVVPIAATWMKFIVTPILGGVAIGAAVWGARKFWWCIQIIRGVCPPPPKATRRGAFAGLAVHLLLITIGIGSGYFLLGLLTTEPYVVTDSGITVGSRPPHYRQRFVSWNEVMRVDCRLGRRSRISKLLIYTTEGREILVNGAVRLEPVRTLLEGHLPSYVMRPCESEDRTD